mmetsp:Transcript_120878/g.188840  ORF Transcript_120878/g.188840 Transcript_120878/m.188840 type:complete len:216 (-) Transcript_120878:120-767(-)
MKDKRCKKTTTAACIGKVPRPQTYNSRSLQCVASSLHRLLLWRSIGFAVFFPSLAILLFVNLENVERLSLAHRKTTNPTARTESAYDCKGTTILHIYPCATWFCIGREGFGEALWWLLGDDHTIGYLCNGWFCTISSFHDCPDRLFCALFSERESENISMCLSIWHIQINQPFFAINFSQLGSYDASIVDAETDFLTIVPLFWFIAKSDTIADFC